MEELGDLKEQLLHYARGIWKNRWLAILIAWVVLIAGFIYVDQIKNRYKAETKVYIDSTSVLKPLLRGLAIETDFEATVQLMVRQLLSRPNLERAILIMDMDLNVDGPTQMEGLVESIGNRVNISADPKSGIYTLTYTDTSRTKARQMVQTLLDIFVEDTLGKSVTESDSAIEFLDNQIEKYDSLLREAEERRESFIRKNIGLMPRDGNNYFAQLQETEAQLEESELILSELRNRRNKIKFQIDELKSQEVEQGAVLRTGLDERIEEQEKRLDDLLLLYTEEHPDVINAQHVLDTLRERKEKETIHRAATKSILDNPVYQELQISLGKAEADISSVNTRVRSVRKKQAELKKLVDIVPKIEAELQRLNRDYEVHRKNYTELVARREQAKISEDVEAGSEQVKFRIIEPPFVPQRADYPNRALFDLVVLVIAIGTGYGISLLLSFLQPVFYSPRELMTHIGGSVLGAISKFDTPSVISKRRMNVVLFGFVNLVFLGSAGFITYLHSQGILILWRLKDLVM
ncbi:MAG: Wzz/FepE/Etk N-terminal domain-containing protein [Gammaproteobacteria bacterium]|nr:Wzz/FepE/Etk N-terminal domain-containing protein [Gammaproteobacteria bacterium]